MGARGLGETDRAGGLAQGEQGCRRRRRGQDPLSAPAGKASSRRRAPSASSGGGVDRPAAAASARGEPSDGSSRGGAPSGSASGGGQGERQHSSRKQASDGPRGDPENAGGVPWGSRSNHRQPLRQQGPPPEAALRRHRGLGRVGRAAAPSPSPPICAEARVGHPEAPPTQSPTLP